MTALSLLLAFVQEPPITPPVAKPESVLLRLKPPVGKPYDYRFTVEEEESGNQIVDMTLRMICKGVKNGLTNVSTAFVSMTLENQDVLEIAPQLRRMRIVTVQDDRGKTLSTRLVDSPKGFPPPPSLALTSVLPEKAVGIGDGWASSVDLPIGRTEVTYTVASFSDKPQGRAVRLTAEAPKFREMESSETWMTTADGMLLSSEIRIKGPKGIQIVKIVRQ